MNEFHRNVWQQWFVRTITILAVSASVCPLSAFGRELAQIKPLQQSFQKPPADCWPHTRWWWFGSAVTREGITWELEQMASHGITGVEQISMGPVYEKGNIRYLSDEYLDMAKHTVYTAKRLGMQVSFNFGGPGWIIGGDWVPKEDRMKDMVPTSMEVQGPSSFAGPLPKQLTQTKRSWEIHIPELDGSERLLAVVAARYSDGGLEPNSVVVLTDKVRERQLQWKVPEGRWRVMAFWLKYHDHGDAVDHMSKPAMQRYCDYIGGKFLQAFGEEFGKTVDSFFCDSFEVPDLPSGFYWSEGLLEEFKKRKGYDLVPYLPALWWHIGEETAKIRYDLNEFLHLIGKEAFFETFLDWCQQHKVQGRIQAYGFTTDNIEGSGITHIPEMEVCPGEKDAVPWFDTRIGPAKYVSSGAHLYGRNLITTEAYTFIHWELYRATLEELKIATDGYLRFGANKFYNHGFSYSPERTPAPSRCMSIDANISPINTWWPHYPLLAEYLARCCHMLRQGEPFADVAVYSPLANQWTLNVLNARKWTREFYWGELGNLLAANGYDFDLINDDVLQNRSRIDEGSIRVNALEYKALILPNVQALPLQTLRVIERYVRAGGVVIALERLPESSVGLADYRQQDLEVKRLVEAMFQEPRGRDGNGHKVYGQGHTYYLKVVLNRQDVLDWRSSALDPFVNTLRAHIQPDFNIDFALQGMRTNNGLAFLHRVKGDADIYFVSNIQEVVSSIPVTFRVQGKVPWRWNPCNGDISAMPAYREHRGGTEIPLQLQPYESCFVVFEPGQGAHVIQSDLAEITAVGARGVEGVVMKNGVYSVAVAGPGGHKTASLSVNDALAPLYINGSWRLRMPLARGAALDTSFSRLFSWTEVERTKHFSGAAEYEIDFDVPKAYVRADIQMVLDVGRVGNVAEILINGKKAGTIWMRGQFCPLHGLVRAGKNHLKVVVTNTLINRVAGWSAPPPVPEELVAHYGSGVTDESRALRGPIGFKALPASGLLGPVQILVQKKVTLALP